MPVPPMIRRHRALATLAALSPVAFVAFVIAPDAVGRGLPFLLLLACPLMMVLMMRPMHQMPAAGTARGDGDPYSQEALAMRLAQLDAERATIAELLDVPAVDHPAIPPTGGSRSGAAAPRVRA